MATVETTEYIATVKEYNNNNNQPSNDYKDPSEDIEIYDDEGNEASCIVNKDVDDLNNLESSKNRKQSLSTESVEVFIYRRTSLVTSGSGTCIHI